ncbi:MAG TPA: hypothetical protein DD636_03485 [Anaerolineaceae bacterium]|jgi:hypothetical protein|nr:hypothetical protein [Anaerolineaceae bacterium]
MDVEKHRELYLAQQQPILDELKEMGIYTNDIFQYLPQHLHEWKLATPTLVKWLQFTTYDPFQETIVRLIGVPWLKGSSVAHDLIELSNKPESSDSLKWAIGNTMAVIANDAVLDDIIKIIDDEENDQSREMFVVSLGNMKDPKVVPYLVKLLDHPDLAGHALVALNKLKAVETIEAVRRLENHPRTWIRNEAKKTVRKFEKILEKQATKKNK